jgi:hypothetical protein
MRLTGEGALASGWPAGGWALCQRAPIAYFAGVSDLSIVPAEGGRAFVAWHDLRGEGHAIYDAAFVTLLTPDGPAAPLLAPDLNRGLSRLSSDRAVPGSSAFALRGMVPNPGPRGSFIRLALPDHAPASLDLFDLAGRRLWSSEIGGLGPGEHEVRLGDGAWFPPGIYLVRLTRGDQAARARICIVR